MDRPIYLAPKRRDLDGYMTEDELLSAITEAATFLGWRWHHVRRSDLALQQGHSGYPDLTLARGGELVFLELKSMIGVLTADQEAWLEELSGGDLRSVLVVRPDRLDQILQMLGARLR
jgi:hypothetical protein